VPPAQAPVPAWPLAVVHQAWRTAEDRVPRVEPEDITAELGPDRGHQRGEQPGVCGRLAGRLPGGHEASPPSALWANPENLTDGQQAKLDWIEKTDPRLYRAYLLKEGARLPFRLKGEEGKYALSRWLKWASRCRIPEFAGLGRKIRRHLKSIHATLDHGLSNGLIESVNTKIRVITRMAFGFHNPAALIGLAMLAHAGLRPDLPGR